MKNWQKVLGTIFILLSLGSPLGGCSSLGSEINADSPIQSVKEIQAVSALREVAPPSNILTLGKRLNRFQPQVEIVSPQNDDVLTQTTVKVQVNVQDFPVFQDDNLGLGPHLHLILDNEPYRSVYSVDEPILLEGLTPGTHTLRIFASRPWHESFKNAGAYAQTTFHVLTPTDSNNPNPELPILSYSSPTGTYGAEPIMLDFYLNNAPLHEVAQSSSDISDWRIEVTVNGQSFFLDSWQTTYLEGFKPGENWLKLGFVDEKGGEITNVFNSTARIINFEPGGQDPLSRLIRGELSADEAQGMVEKRSGTNGKTQSTGSTNNSTKSMTDDSDSEKSMPSELIFEETSTLTPDAPQESSEEGIEQAGKFPSAEAIEPSEDPTTEEINLIPISEQPIEGEKLNIESAGPKLEEITPQESQEGEQESEQIEAQTSIYAEESEDGS